VLAVGTDAGERVERLLAEGLIEAFLPQLGVAQNCSQWPSRNIEFAEPRDCLLVEPGCFAKLELANILPEVDILPGSFSPHARSSNETTGVRGPC